jgi:hypothetical protein
MDEHAHQASDQRLEMLEIYKKDCKEMIYEHVQRTAGFRS